MNKYIKFSWTLGVLVVSAFSGCGTSPIVSVKESMNVWEMKPLGFPLQKVLINT